MHIDLVAEYAMTAPVNYAFANHMERLDRGAYEATNTPCECNEWCRSNSNTSAVVGDMTCIRDYANCESYLLQMHMLRSATELGNYHEER